MAQTIKELLLSGTTEGVLAGLEQITGANLYAHLPALMEVIKAGGEGSKAAASVVSAHVKTVLKTPESRLESRVKEALVRILLQLEPDVTARIAREFKASDPKGKIDLCYLLNTVGDGKASVQLLSEALHDNNRLVRACAVRTLGRIANRREPGIIVRFLTDRDSRVRANAVEAMEDTGNVNMTGILLRLKGDVSNRVRANVLKTLFKCGYRDLDKDLTLMVKSADELMRASGAWVIGEIGRKSAAFAPLLEILKSDASVLVQTNLLIARDKIARGKVSDKAGPRGARATGIRKEITRKSAVNITRESTRYFDIVKVSGMLNVYSMIPLKLEVQELFDGGSNKIAFNFTMVDDVDSAVINFIRNLNKRIRETGGKFMIFGVKRDIMDAFNIANLDSTVLIFGAGEKVEHLLG